MTNRDLEYLVWLLVANLLTTPRMLRQYVRSRMQRFRTGRLRSDLSLEPEETSEGSIAGEDFSFAIDRCTQRAIPVCYGEAGELEYDETLHICRQKEVT